MSSLLFSVERSRLEVADGVLTLGLDYSSCVNGEWMSNWFVTAHSVRAVSAPIELQSRRGHFKMPFIFCIDYVGQLAVGGLEGRKILLS